MSNLISKVSFQRIWLCSMVIVLGTSNVVRAQDKNETITSKTSYEYLQNRSPLAEKPFLELPLGAIQPDGWLHEQLVRMKDGMTGRLDELYPEVVGPRNGWLGGDGDGWERGPYWIDGLLPLAYILEDDKMIEKTQPWIEWTLNNQRKDGYLGPIPFADEPEPEAGLQRGMREDWWPKMVMLKILMQYYSATEDERVITALTKYFKYQLEELPERPLDFLTFWANRRGGDNLQAVLWLYNITGDKFLLELADIIAEQTFPWTEVFLNDITRKQLPNAWSSSGIKYPFEAEEMKDIHVSKLGSLHCVNFAQGIKEPVVYYQYDKDDMHLKASRQGFADINYFHGQPQGMYGGDEPLHGQDPTKGVEFCSISESMYSLETMLPITGDMFYADLLEKIVYNALPTQANDDFTTRQYFQAANQVEISDKLQASYQTQTHEGTDFVYGLLSGYPCCTTNMHQSWPKFVQNLWYASADGGIAAFLYAPNTVRMRVKGGEEVMIKESTQFPFKETVQFELSLTNETAFPFYLRIPDWTEGATININGTPVEFEVENQVAKIDRIWKNGDKITLTMPMHLETSQWFDFAHTIERGPLVYSLRVAGQEKKKNRGDKYGEFTEVYPVDPWNFALMSSDLKSLSSSFEVETKDWDGTYPWNLDNVPIQLKGKGVEIPEWTTVNGVPVFPAWWGRRQKSVEASRVKDITLVPYGATTLRITEFPVFQND